MKKKVCYKYLPISRISYFEDGLLRFTQPKQLNDSFECSPIFFSCNELLSKIKGVEFNEKSPKSLSLSEVNGNFVLEEYFEQLKDQSNGFGILSLSKRYNSNLMWSHYAKHTGYVVGFDLNHRFFNSKKFISGKVKYSNDRILLDENESKDIFFTKSKDWSYEKEFRLIAELKDYDKKNENMFLYKIPFETITEVVVGLYIDQLNFIKIKHFCDEHKISLYMCTQSNKSYTLLKQLIV